VTHREKTQDDDDDRKCHTKLFLQSWQLAKQMSHNYTYNAIFVSSSEHEKVLLWFVHKQGPRSLMRPCLSISYLSDSRICYLIRMSSLLSDRSTSHLGKNTKNKSGYYTVSFDALAFGGMDSCCCLDQVNSGSPLQTGQFTSSS
jgi:hypothetical protein